MSNSYRGCGVLVLAAILLTMPARAVTVTFEGVEEGATSLAFDCDGDAIHDVVFTSFSSSGFGWDAPWPDEHMTFIDGYALVSPANQDPDVRVDFVVDAVDAVRFGFALEFVGGLSFAAPGSDYEYTVSFELFDRGGTSLGSTTTDGHLIVGNDCEGEVFVLFDGRAAYGLVDFTSYYSEYGNGSFVSSTILSLG